MSQTHAHPAHTPSTHEKHQAGTADSQHDPIPAPDQGGHARSHAAHLEQEGAIHTKAEGNLRQGAAPGELREPPMVVQRVGKQNRGS